MSMKYKIISIVDYFSCLEVLGISEKFGEGMRVKRKAYKEGHEDRYFPLTDDDLYGNHYFICDASNDRVIVTFKVVPFSSSQQFVNTIFPFEHYIRPTCSDTQYSEIQKYMNNFKKRGLDFSYSGGWAMNNDYRGMGLSRELRNIYSGIHYNIHKDLNISACMGVGIIEKGTYDFFNKHWGFECLLDGESVVMPNAPSINCHFIGQSFEHFSDNKRMHGMRYRQLWDEREEYSVKEEMEAKLIKKSA